MQSKLRQIAQLGNNTSVVSIQQNEHVKSSGPPTKKHCAEFILPRRLVDEIRKKTPGYLHRDAFTVTSSIFLKHLREDAPLDTKSSFARNYFYSLPGGKKNHKAVKALEKVGILQVYQDGDHPTYIPPVRDKFGKIIKPGICRKIGINPSLLSGEIDIIWGKRRQQDKLTEIENLARMCLEGMKIPFENGEARSAWVHSFIRKKEMQQRIASCISKLNTRNVCPHAAHLVYTEESSFRTKVIEGENISTYLHSGYNLYAYQNRSSKTSYYIANPGELQELKTRELEMSFNFQLAILNEIRFVPNLIGRNNTNKRLDSPLTNLFSQFIALVTVNGEHLQGIDITNSQFTFFAGILAEVLHLVENDTENFAFFSNNKFSFDSDNKGLDAISSEKSKKAFFALKSSNYKLLQHIPNQTLQNLIPYLCPKYGITTCKTEDKLAQNRAYIKKHFADLKKFIEVCRNGSLYEYIASRKYFQKDLDALSSEEKTFITTSVYRAKAKGAMLSLSFDKWNVAFWNERKAADRAILDEVFPSVLRIIDHIKKSAVEELKRRRKEDSRLYNHIYYKSKKGRVETPNEVGNSLFAVMLQRIESVIVIDGILRKVMRRYWAASKHDSILCVVSQFEKVLKVMRKELDSVLGVGNYRLKKQSWVYDPETMKIETIEEKLNF